MGRAKRHVVPHRWAEELIVWILEDEPHLGANAANRLIRHWHPCHMHGAVRWAMDPVEVQHEGALPRAVRPEQCNLLATGDRKIHAAQRLGSIGVAEVQVRDCNRAVARWRERRVVGMIVTVAMRHRCPWVRV